MRFVSLLILICRVKFDVDRTDGCDAIDVQSRHFSRLPGGSWLLHQDLLVTVLCCDGRKCRPQPKTANCHKTSLFFSLNRSATERAASRSADRCTTASRDIQTELSDRFNDFSGLHLSESDVVMGDNAGRNRKRRIATKAACFSV